MLRGNQDSLSKVISNKGAQGKMLIIFLIIILLCYSLNTYKRNRLWEEGTAVWFDCVLKSPYKARPHNNLGYAYDDKGMLDEAISAYKKSIANNPNYALSSPRRRGQ